MDENPCDRFRELVWAHADELEPSEASALAAHLEACAACGAESEGVAGVRDALAPAPDEEGPGDDVLGRVQSRLSAARESAVPGSEVLTPEELAEMLQVSVDDIFENLDQLPAFEFAGRVRFRRRAIEAWLQEQEQRWRTQSLSMSVRR